MKNFRKRWISSILAVALVFTMFAGGIPLSAYAQQGGDSEQPTNQEGAKDGLETAVIAAPRSAVD